MLRKKKVLKDISRANGSERCGTTESCRLLQSNLNFEYLNCEWEIAWRERGEIKFGLKWIMRRHAGGDLPCRDIQLIGSVEKTSVVLEDLRCIAHYTAS